MKKSLFSLFILISVLAYCNSNVDKYADMCKAEYKLLFSGEMNENLRDNIIEGMKVIESNIQNDERDNFFYNIELISQYCPTSIIEYSISINEKYNNKF